MKVIEMAKIVPNAKEGFAVITFFAMPKLLLAPHVFRSKHIVNIVKDVIVEILFFDARVKDITQSGVVFNDVIIVRAAVRGFV